MAAFTTTSAASNQIINLLFIIAIGAVAGIAGVYLSSDRFMAAPLAAAEGISKNRPGTSSDKDMKLTHLAEPRPDGPVKSLYCPPSGRCPVSKTCA